MALQQRCTDLRAAHGSQRAAAPRLQQIPAAVRNCKVTPAPRTIGVVSPVTQRRNVSSSMVKAVQVEAEGDVYVNDLTPLNEGEVKHVISVFVADEPGLINRVAGVFARRGANIESLAVGLTSDKALFTIVSIGTAKTVANLVKQLSKLVKVRYVEDITETTRMERELLLVKVAAPAGEARTELLETCNIFRARVVDVADASLTVVVSGDPGKITAFLRTASKFGIVEIARTGRVCLKRGSNLLQGTAEVHKVSDVRKSKAAAAASNGVPASTSGRNGAAVPAGGAATAAAPSSSRAADVYNVDLEEREEVWDVDNILEATYSNQPTGFAPYTLSIDVQDVPGVLNQVTGVFARRGYNVQSLAVGPSETHGISRIIMVVPGTEESIAKLIRQVQKLVYVQEVSNLTSVPFSTRELMLVKVRCSAGQRSELRDLTEIFRGSVLDVCPSTMTIEVLGKEDKMQAFVDLLEPYGVLEIARTGRIALARDSGVDSRLLQHVKTARVW